MNKNMKKFLNDTLLGKMVKTFFEGFIASLTVSLPTITDFSNFNFLQPVIVGAIAMGLSAVLNLIQNKINKEV